MPAGSPGLLVKGDERWGVIGHVVLGIVGAIVGGFLAYNIFGLNSGAQAQNGDISIGSIIVSIIGAVIVVWVVNFFMSSVERPDQHRRKRYAPGQSPGAFLPVPRSVRCVTSGVGVVADALRLGARGRSSPGAGREPRPPFGGADAAAQAVRYRALDGVLGKADLAADLIVRLAFRGELEDPDFARG